MANYYEQARSSYFEVKSVEDFEDFCEIWSLESIRKKTDDSKTLYGFLAHEGIMEPDEDSVENILCEEDGSPSFAKELARQLKEGWVAIIMGNGYEKMRYLTGFATAISACDAHGNYEEKSVSLEDIYDLAKDMGNSTSCTY